MGLTDKITGRVKQAAGDLAGNDDLKRQGKQEERKGDAEQEQVRAEARAKAERTDAERKQEDARERAAQAAQREFDKADAESERQQKRVDRAEAAASKKADEAANLERRTDSAAMAQDHTKDELYEKAQALDVEGRSDMTKDELADAVRRGSGEGERGGERGAAPRPAQPARRALPPPQPRRRALERPPRDPGGGPARRGRGPRGGQGGR